MFRFFRKLSLTVGLLLAPSVVLAQLGSVPHVFTAGTTISSSDMNANFSTAYSIALNRTGGTMTGSLTTLAIVPTTDALYDMGTSLAKYRDFYLSRNASIGGTLAVTGNGGFLSTLSAVGAVTFSSTLGVAGAANFSSTVTASSFIGSGASLTGIPETAITDGSILARVAANETISGVWTFATNQVLNGNTFLSGISPGLIYSETDGGTDLKHWEVYVDSANYRITTLADNFAGSAAIFILDRAGNLNIAGAMSANSLFSVAAGSIGTSLAVGTTLSAGTTISAGTSITATTTITATTYLVGTSGVKERSRTTAMGVGEARGFSAGNYVGVGGTWTVESGDVTSETWRMVGDTLFFSLRLNTTTMGASVTAIRVTIPGGFTATDSGVVFGNVTDTGGAVAYPMTCVVTAGLTYVSCGFANNAAFVTGTNNQSVGFQIYFSVL